MLPPELSDDPCSLRPHVDRLVRDRRVPAERRRAALLPLGDPQRRAADLRPGAAARRAGPRLPRSSSSPPRTRPSCAGAASPAGRCGSSGPSSSFEFDGEGRRRGCPLGRRAGGARARRGADDRRERGGRRAARRPQPGGALPRARAARPAVRSLRSSPSSPSSTCRPRRCRSSLTAGDAAARRGRVSERVTEYVAQSGRGREAFPALVLRSLKQARYDPRNLGHSGLASPRLLPLHEPDPPLPRPVVHRALLRELGARRRAAARAPRRPRRAHLGARARGGRDRVPRRRHLPRLAARRPSSSSAAGTSRGRARSSA